MMAFELTMKGTPPTDPRERVLAVEAAVGAICSAGGSDVADGVMALLTAACHVTMKIAPHLSERGRIMFLAERLGNADAAAEGFFTLRPVSPTTPGSEEP